MTYTFRNRFRLLEGDRLDAGVEGVELTDPSDDVKVTLGAPEIEMGLNRTGAPISQAGELLVQGSGYADVDTAATAGRMWRQHLLVALARESKGVDFGPDDEVIPTTDKIFEYPPGLFQMMGVKVGDRVIIDSRQLQVFLTRPTPKFINIIGGTPAVEISGWLDGLRQKVGVARA